MEIPQIHESVKNEELRWLRARSLLGAMATFTGSSGTNGEEKDDGIGERCPSDAYCPREFCILSWLGWESYVESWEDAE